MVSSSSESGGESSGSLGSVVPLLNTSGPPEEPPPKNLGICKFNLVVPVSVTDPDPRLLKDRFRVRIKVISWIQIKGRIRLRIRIKVISWIRIRFNLQMTNQNVMNRSLFNLFSKF
jgi:hypothetical protein